MHEAITRMLSKYAFQRVEDYDRALREILQQVALLGLWRSKFFEKAAFYGGTALRMLYGLDRFSEDLDFSLLEPETEFSISPYIAAVEKEIHAFGFDVRVEEKIKSTRGAVKSAFLKADTTEQLITINTPEHITHEIPRGKVMKIRIEIDTDPPEGFDTETKYILAPIPFSVRSFTLPDLFAGKMHAVLCRRWKKRVKGRDWYDFVWYVSNYPRLHLSHLEARMRQTGDWRGTETLTHDAFGETIHNTIDLLDVDRARADIEHFVSNPETLTLWSRDFFHQIVSRIVLL